MSGRQTGSNRSSHDLAGHKIKVRRRASRSTVAISWHSRTVALTDGRGGCQTVAGRIERKRFGAVFSCARVSPYNKRTMEVGLWGHLGLQAGCRISKLRVINVME